MLSFKGFLVEISDMWQHGKDTVLNKFYADKFYLLQGNIYKL